MVGSYGSSTTLPDSSSARMSRSESSTGATVTNPGAARAPQAPPVRPTGDEPAFSARQPLPLCFPDRLVGALPHTTHQT